MCSDRILSTSAQPSFNKARINNNATTAKLINNNFCSYVLISHGRGKSTDNVTIHNYSEAVGNNLVINMGEHPIARFRSSK